MSVSKEIQFRLTIDGKDFEGKLHVANESLKEIQKNSQGVTNNMSHWAGMATGLNQALELVQKIYSVASEPLKIAGEFEQFTVQLEVLLGGTEKAHSRISELSEFAATTPFELPQVVRASKQLEVLTKGALSTGDGLRMVGDVSAGVGVNIDELAMWFGRLYDAIQSGRPAGEALMRLQELGAMSGNARGEIERLSKANADSTIIWKQVTDEMKRFSGMMEKQSATFEGKVSNLKDEFTLLLRDVGNIIMPLAQTIVGGLKSISGGIREILGVEEKLSEKIHESQSEYNALVNLLKDTNTSQDTRRQIIETLNSKYKEYLGNLNLEKAAIADIEKMQLKANEAFKEKIKLVAAKEQYQEQTSQITELQKRIFNAQVQQRKENARVNKEYGSDYEGKERFIEWNYKYYIEELENEKAKLEKEFEEFNAFVKSQGIDINKNSEDEKSGENDDDDDDSTGKNKDDKEKAIQKLNRMRIENIEDEKQRKIKLLEFEYELEKKNILNTVKDKKIAQAQVKELTLKHNNELEKLKNSKDYDPKKDVTKLQKMRIKNILDEKKRKIELLNLEYKLEKDNITKTVKDKKLAQAQIKELTVKHNRELAKLNQYSSTGPVKVDESLKPNLLPSMDEMETQFSAFNTLISASSDVLRSEMSGAWEEVFGKANSVIEKIGLRFFEMLADRALQDAMSSLLSSGGSGGEGGSDGTNLFNVLLMALPFLAEGAVVTKPTIAMIGEDGAEAVIPLNKPHGREALTDVLSHNLLKETVRNYPVSNHAASYYDTSKLEQVIGDNLTNFVRAMENKQWHIKGNDLWSLNKNVDRKRNDWEME